MEYFKGFVKMKLLEVKSIFGKREILVPQFKWEADYLIHHKLATAFEVIMDIVLISLLIAFFLAPVLLLKFVT